MAYRPRPAPQGIWASWLFRCEPLELEYLYTVLKAHADITLLDGQIKNYKLAREVARRRPDLLLLTSLITNVNTVLQLAAEVKRLDPSPMVFIGGPHAEVLPQHFFTPDVDGVFISNQLVAIEAVVKAVAAGQPYRDQPGAAFPVEGTFRINTLQRADPADFPIPERPLLRAHRGKYNLFYYDDCASLKTSLGCPERCNFCFCRKMNLGAYGRRPVESVLRELESIPNQNVFIVDDNFLLSPEWLRAFCRGIKARSIRKRLLVYGTSRFVGDHPELMNELRDAGLSAILVGLEFISDDALAAVRKASSAADNEECIRVCRALDIELIALFMLDPDQPPSEYRTLADFVRKRRVHLATYATLTTFPGTDLWAEQGKGAVRIEELWRYDLLRLHSAPRHMSRLGYYRWMIYLYLRPMLGVEWWLYLSRRAGVRTTTRMAASGVISLCGFLRKVIVWP